MEPAPDPQVAEDVPEALEPEPAGSDPDDAERAVPPPPPPAPAPTPAHAPVPPTAASDATPGPESFVPAAGLPPPRAEANGSFDRRKKRRTEDGDGSKSCSCKKSKCLKLYCVCFSSGTHCTESCGCEPCHNKPGQGSPGSAPAPVLPLKFAQTSEAGQDLVELPLRSPMDIFRRKCNCKKSGCLKKYCDCYQGRAGCSINCKCEDCKNPFGRKGSIIFYGNSSFVAPPTLNEGNGTEVDSSDDEDDYYMNRTLSPIPPSPVSRESSFQQETQVGVEIQTMNGHLYPKPLTQVRPESSSFQLTRRPGEEVRGEQWHFSRKPSEDGISDAMEGHNVIKFQRNNKKPERHMDRFSIPRCIEVMNAMSELSLIEKSLAPDVFLEPSNREIFLTLSVDVRTLWLKRKMKTLV